MEVGPQVAIDEPLVLQQSLGEQSDRLVPVVICPLDDGTEITRDHGFIDIGVGGHHGVARRDPFLHELGVLHLGLERRIYVPCVPGDKTLHLERLHVEGGDRRFPDGEGMEEGQPERHELRPVVDPGNRREYAAIEPALEHHLPDIDRIRMYPEPCILSEGGLHTDVSTFPGLLLPCQGIERRLEIIPCTGDPALGPCSQRQ